MKQDHTSRTFENLRKSPTELSLQEVSSIIEKLPLIATTVGTSSIITKGFFNTKFLIMTSIPIAIIAGAITLMTSSEASLSPSELATDEKTEANYQENQDDTNSEIASFPSDKLEEAVSFSRTESTATGYLDTPSILNLKYRSAKKSSLDSIIPRIISPSKLEITFNNIDPIEKSINIDFEKISIEYDKDGKKEEMHLLTPSSMINFNASYPDLTSLQMIQLKRKLYKNLTKDGIILSEKIPVEIFLKGNEILVNDKVLNPDQFLKYSKLTNIAGTGKLRKIKIDPLYILVGDFTPEGFIGSGYGTFQEDFRPNEGSDIFQEKEEGLEKDLFFIKSKDAKSEKREKEEEALLEFSRITTDKSTVVKSFSLFSTNLKDGEGGILHAELYGYLIDDNIISRKDDMAVLEVTKNELKINGKVIEVSVAMKYLDLCKEFRIKPSKNRQIRLSQNIIMAGDFYQNKFRGSISYLD